MRLMLLSNGYSAIWRHGASPLAFSSSFSLSSGTSASSSAALLPMCVRFERAQPKRQAQVWMAHSVGSPCAVHSPDSFSRKTLARLQSVETLRKLTKCLLSRIFDGPAWPSVTVSSLSSSSSIGRPSLPFGSERGSALPRVISPRVGLKGSFVALTVYTPVAGTQALRTTILPCVSVPVLSEQMSVTPPRASSDSSLRTMTWRFTMAREPMLIVIVRTAVREAGIMEVPVATA
jgi:hypothetical protein